MKIVEFPHDLAVNGADMTLWKGDFGVAATCDADGDGDTDGADLLIWQRNVGASAGAIAVVPEPATALSLCLGVVALRNRVHS